MAYSKSYNKRTGVTYVYEVLESKWSPERKRCEQKRKLIGKLDEKTGEIIPTGPRGRPKGKSSGSYVEDSTQALRDALDQERRKVEEMARKVRKRDATIARMLKEQNRKLVSLTDEIQHVMEANRKLLEMLENDAETV